MGRKKKRASTSAPALRSAVDSEPDMEETSGNFYSLLDRHEEDEESELRQQVEQMTRRSKRRHQLGDDYAEDKVAMAIDADDESDEDDEDDWQRPQIDAKQYEADPMASDLEDEGENAEEDEAVGVDTWGSRKKYFYGGNPNERPMEREDDNEMSEAEMEAIETEKLQSKLLGSMDEEDFVSAFVTEKSDEKVDKDLAKDVKIDLSTLSKKAKIKLFKEEAPEFEGIVQDFNSKLEIAQNELVPLIEFVDESGIKNTAAIKLLRMKLKLILNYAANIACYLSLKATRAPLRFHPLNGRLLQYKRLIDEIDAKIDNKTRKQVDSILQSIKEGQSVEEIVAEHQTSNTPVPRRRRLKVLEQNKSDDSLKRKSRKVEVSQIASVAPNTSSSEDEEAPDESLEPKESSGKRGITYEIAKNKGLTPRRSKLQRNPRVKHRYKFQKAQTRRKGQVRALRTETSKYGGEASGINVRVRKGIKLG